MLSSPMTGNKVTVLPAEDGYGLDAASMDFVSGQKMAKGGGGEWAESPFPIDGVLITPSGKSRGRFC